MLAELLGHEVDYATLTEDERQLAEERLPGNGFRYWLLHKAETVAIEVGATSASGYFQNFVDNNSGG